MTVSWVTMNATSASIVEYGVNELSKSAHGESNKFVDGGSEHRSLYVHKVTLTKLIPEKTYSEYSFTTCVDSILQLRERSLFMARGWCK